MSFYICAVFLFASVTGSVGHHEWGPTVQQLSEPFDHGEEPTWDSRTQLLYFVDIFKGLINSYNPVNNAINSIRLDGSVSPVIPTKKPGRFVVGVNKTAVLVEWDGRNSTGAQVLQDLAHVTSGVRFNDGKADQKGRLWWGTIGYEDASGVVPHQAGFYKITKTDLNNPQVMIPNVTNSNGLAWSKDNRYLYYIDTPTRKIARYDFDLNAGTISNKVIAFDLENYDVAGLPDGMTIDTDDNLYVALYDGGSVIKVNPKTGALLQRIAIPAQKVTSVMWGGKFMDTLFVTTSRHGLTQEENGHQPAAGSLFGLMNMKATGRQTFYANF